MARSTCSRLLFLLVQSRICRMKGADARVKPSSIEAPASQGGVGTAVVPAPVSDAGNTRTAKVNTTVSELTLNLTFNRHSDCKSVGYGR